MIIENKIFPDAGSMHEGRCGVSWRGQICEYDTLRFVQVSRRDRILSGAEHGRFSEYDFLGGRDNNVSEGAIRVKRGRAGLAHISRVSNIVRGIWVWGQEERFEKILSWG